MSKEVKRYGMCGFESGIVEMEDGPCVAWADYEALLEENEQLRATQYGSGRMQALRDERDALLAERDRMAEALESCMDALWEDSREVRLDDTMMFVHGYDWDGWESFRWELHTRAGSFAIWPAHGTYSAYGGNDGSYWNQMLRRCQRGKSRCRQACGARRPKTPSSKSICRARSISRRPARSPAMTIQLKELAGAIGITVAGSLIGTLAYVALLGGV